MPNSPGRFRAAVGVGWLALSLTAIVYARMKGIPAWAALPIAAAFLIEFPFYLLPAFNPERLRNPWLLLATCVLPYFVFALPTGEFQKGGFAALLIAMQLTCLWYAALPQGILTDAGFLLLLAFIEISRLFNRIYFFHALPKLQISTLGHLMLIRTAAIAILAIRGGAPLEYRFLPRLQEWRSGIKWFLLMLPVVAVALWEVQLWKIRPVPNPLLVLGEFLGILWVTALSEEFFFRGLLQHWLEQWTGSSVAALLVASLLFGAAHLWMHVFPNWRYAIIASILGLFCGLAWRETRSIQASMVTHALAATLYRVFLFA